MGRNPRNGGSPPSDRKFVMNVNLTNLFFKRMLFIWFTKKVLVEFRMNTIFMLIIE